MASNSLKLVFLLILISFFNFQTPDAEEVTYFTHECSENTSTANNTFQVKVTTLLNSLSSNATVRNFYNDTVSDRNASNAVYGLFMCRGDVPSQLCGQCVLNATQRLSSECYLSTWAIIWYYECMVRYSNSSFFSAMATWPGFLLSTTAAYVSNQASFVPLLHHTLNETADEAAFSLGGDRYATKEAKVSENQTLFCLTQCTLDISPKDCRECVTSVIRVMTPEGRLGWKSFSPSCTVRYELYPFYPINAPGQGGLLPATKHLETDSIYSQDPGYLSHNCSSYGYQDYKQEIDTLLSYLSSNATSSSNNNRFYKADVGAAVFGLFMCRGDIPLRLCGQCVVNATHRIASKCPSNMFGKAIIWYDRCFLRYSNQPFFDRMSTSPRFDNLNVTKVNDLESSFRFSVLSNALAKAVEETASSDEKYWTQSFILNDNQTLYVLAQCTQDLPYLECYSCLSDVIGSAIPWSRLGSVGGRVQYPSCTMRFELFQFYRNVVENHAPPPLIHSPVVLPPPTERKHRSRATILIIVAIVVLVILFSFCCYLLWKKARRSYILRQNFGHESTTVEQLQFDLAIIKAATNNFSHENRIGKGGFGEVYKGVLLDGRHIAAKRLSKSSKQGAIEFKNEVLLIAKLQHRNLVAFIGFCLEDQEKILLYEYVPNKSLDYFLFDAHSTKLLSWPERHKIIEGIARGILYLHEYSRLKVIHRDLKPSNVLLDENMNSKISDFGLARIIEIDQQQGSTNRIVGTLGYMPPEYAMLGQFSEKSDVFSFGVMVLEIITGKRNLASYESHGVADGLLSSVWRRYRDQTPLNILDPKLRENYQDFEVFRCIQIGLLCVQEDPSDRPTMMAVVSYFSNYSIELPYPREPAFFLRHEMDRGIVAHNSSSTSVNMMSTSNIFPR